MVLESACAFIYEVFVFREWGVKLPVWTGSAPKPPQVQIIREVSRSHSEKNKTKHYFSVCCWTQRSSLFRFQHKKKVLMQALIGGLYGSSVVPHGDMKMTQRCLVWLSVAPSDVSHLCSHCWWYVWSEGRGMGGHMTPSVPGWWLKSVYLCLATASKRGWPWCITFGRMPAPLRASPQHQPEVLPEHCSSLFWTHFLKQFWSEKWKNIYKQWGALIYGTLLTR